MLWRNTKLLSLLYLTSTLVLSGRVEAAPDLSRLSAYGGAGFNAVRVESGTATDRESSAAYGAALEAALGPDFGLEAGFIKTEEDLEIPVLARFGGGRTINFGLGPVFQNIEGEEDTFHLGVSAGPGINFHIARDFDLFLEGRVTRAFRDGLVDFGDDQTDFNALAGFRLALN